MFEKKDLRGGLYGTIIARRHLNRASSDALIARDTTLWWRTSEVDGIEDVVIWHVPNIPHAARIERLHERVKRGDPDMTVDELQSAIDRAAGKRRELEGQRASIRLPAREHGHPI